MPDFITERDPIKVFTPQPNTFGQTPEQLAAKDQLKKLEKEHLKLCDTLENLDYLPQNQESLEKYQNTIKAINSKWHEIEQATKRLSEMEE